MQNPEPAPGLSDEEAAARLKRDGSNRIAPKGRRGIGQIGIALLTQPMFLLLLATAGVYALVGSLGDALVLLASVVAVAAIAVVQDYRTARVLESLKELSSPRARVLRSGRLLHIASQDLVLGDRLLIAEGDRLACDAGLVEVAAVLRALGIGQLALLGLVMVVALTRVAGLGAEWMRLATLGALVVGNLLLLQLQRLKAAAEIPTELPIFLDSPMATAATALYQRHHKLLRIKAREAATLTEGVNLVATPDESQRLTRSRWPKVVISAAAMASGGRVLFHLKAMAPNPRNAIVFPGFQVVGTRGANLIAGAKEVKIHAEFIAVKAELSHLEGFSGRADANELMDRLRALDAPPAKTSVVHGEPAAADALRLRIKSELGWPVAVPGHGSSVEV